MARYSFRASDVDLPHPTRIQAVLTCLSFTQRAHSLHESAVDDTRLAIVPLGVTVALVLVLRLSRRLVEPPEVLPRIKKSCETIATVEIANWSNDAASFLYSPIKARLGVRNVDLQEGWRERPILLSITKHDGGISNHYFRMDDRTISIRRANMRCFSTIENCFHEVDEAHGVGDDSEGIYCVVSSRDFQRSHVYIKYE